MRGASASFSSFIFVSSTVHHSAVMMTASATAPKANGSKKGLDDGRRVIGVRDVAVGTPIRERGTWKCDDAMGPVRVVKSSILERNSLRIGDVLAVAHHYIDSRCLAFQRTADDGQWQQVIGIGGHQRQPAGGCDQGHGHRHIVHPVIQFDVEPGTARPATSQR